METSFVVQKFVHCLIKSHKWYVFSNHEPLLTLKHTSEYNKMRVLRPSQRRSWGFRCFGCDAALLGIWFLTFRSYVISSSSRVKRFRHLEPPKPLGPLTPLRWRLPSFETSASTHPMTQRHIPKTRILRWNTCSSSPVSFHLKSYLGCFCHSYRPVILSTVMCGVES
jgi:hypothetical protein